MVAQRGSEPVTAEDMSGGTLGGRGLPWHMGP